MKIWYLTADLMFCSRVESAAQHAGASVEIIGSPSALREKLAANDARPGMVLIDLLQWSPEVAEVIASIKALSAPPKIVAYGPHVQEAQLDAAHAAGCDLVLTRGQFDRQMEAVLRVT